MEEYYDDHTILIFLKNTTLELGPPFNILETNDSYCITEWISGGLKKKLIIPKKSIEYIEIEKGLVNVK